MDEREDGGSSSRTGLAWHRTALSVLVVGAIVYRLTVTELGWAALIPLVLAVPVAWSLVSVRDRSTVGCSGQAGLVPVGRGFGSIALAGLVAAMGCVELAAVVLRA